MAKCNGIEAVGRADDDRLPVIGSSKQSRSAGQVEIAEGQIGPP